MTDDPSTIGRFELRLGSDLAQSLAVISFQGREALSEFFSFDVVVLVPPPLEHRESVLLGASATLVLHGQDGSARRIAGVLDVVRAEAGARGRGAVRVRLVPALALLKRRRTTRIFQDLTVPEILGKILGAAELPFAFRLTRAYQKRAYCVQYRESDYAFVRRLAAEEGIVFLFVDPPASDPAQQASLLFIDSPAEYPLAEGGAGPLRLIFREDEGLASSEQQVLRFASRRAIRPTALRLRDYDFRRPNLPLAERAGSEEGEGYEVYEHRGDYEEPEVTQDKARIALDQERRTAWIFEAESLCSRLAPGLRFRLDGESALGLDGDYAAVRVEHVGQTPELGVAAPRRVYSNRFRCVPGGVLFRPRSPRRAPRQVLETATVVGPPGHDVHTDEHGRIKVQFHWDLEGKRDENSSAWLRVTQAWAGAAYGAQFIPRVGMEVLVSFLGGDTDCPIVTGCLYNATHPPPFPLPQDKLKSGFRTQSSPGEGMNELHFDDRAGRERVFLSAQRDFDEVVGQNHSLSVTSNQTISVGGSRQDSVGGSRAVQTAGSVLVQTAGSSEEQIAGIHKLTVGDGRLATVHGNEIDTVKGNSFKTVEREASLRVAGNFSMEVGTETEPAAADIFAWGDYGVGSYAGLRLRAQDGITLVCGDSRIEITPTSITLTSPNLMLGASASVTVQSDGPMLRLEKDAELVADSVKLYASKASLELEKDAHLNGELVKLNCGAGDPSELIDEDGNPKLQHLSLKLTDVAFQPYANKDFIVRAAGAKVEGSTDGEGKLEVDLPIEAKSAEITLWLEKRPTGKTKRYVVKLGELPGPDTTQGAQLRLRNLGYYWGATGDAVDSATAKALKDFQTEHGLEPTGALDGPTQAKLAEIHGR